MASHQGESSSPSTSAPPSSGSAWSEDVTSGLARAVFAGDVPKVQRLIDAGATTAELHFYTLFSACLHGVDMIRALLASPDTTFDVLQLGVPLLHYILLAPDDQFDKANIVLFLIEHGADPFKCDKYGENALHILARIATNTEIYLLRDISSNASVESLNKPNFTGMSALYAAVTYSNLEAARVLLEAGASPDVGDIADGTPFKHAVRERNNDMVELLLKFGAQLPKNDKRVMAIGSGKS